METYEGFGFRICDMQRNHLGSLVNWRLCFRRVQVGPGILRFLFSKGLGCCRHKTTLPIRCQAPVFLVYISLVLWTCPSKALTLDQCSVFLVYSCWKPVSTELKHSLQGGGEIRETLGTSKRSQV